MTALVELFDALRGQLGESGLGRLVPQVLDVVVVYYVVYRALLLVKGTRAAQMLVGLGLVSIAVLAARYLNLGTVTFLLDSMLANAILVVVVLFQADIRRALSQVGRGTWLGNLSTREAPLFIEELVRACSVMSENRIGALIVIQRAADLSEFTEEGVALDARVTRELLLSVFHPTSPLHDGAVILQEGRVTAAGCFLPLTTNSDVSRIVGTRHRAAIGISEETDCVVIVVSEYAGTISLALEGRLTRDLDATTLRTVLQGLLTRRQRQWPRIGRDRRVPVETT